MKDQPSKKDQPKRLFRVSPRQVNQTIAAALRQWLPDEPSWGAVRKLVQQRCVLVNGNLCQDQGRRLKLTDVVSVLAHSTAPPAREQDVRVRWLDTQLVVVEKPSGMTSVRHAEEQQWTSRRKQQNPTLEDLLPRIIAKKEAAGPARRSSTPGRRPVRTPPVRPVHRLDRETSGLIVFARTVPAERHLGQQFRKHTAGRRYLAIVEGRIGKQTITSNLVRDRGDGRRGSTTLESAGKRAVTHVRPLETFDDYTLVECVLETGRTHQIRIHLSEAGHAVCADKVYRSRAVDAAPDTSGAPRLALHATELRFEHPTTGKRMDFQMPLPADLQQFLDRLRQGQRSQNEPRP